MGICENRFRRWDLNFVAGSPRTRTAFDNMVSLEQSTRLKVLILLPSGTPHKTWECHIKRKKFLFQKRLPQKTGRSLLTPYRYTELRQDIVKALWRMLNAEFINMRKIVVVHKFFG